MTEARKAYLKAWREAHKDELRAYNKAYQRANYERYKPYYQAYGKAYYKAHKDEIKAREIRRFVYETAMPE